MKCQQSMLIQVLFIKSDGQLQGDISNRGIAFKSRDDVKA